MVDVRLLYIFSMGRKHHSKYKHTFIFSTTLTGYLQGLLFFSFVLYLKEQLETNYLGEILK